MSHLGKMIQAYLDAHPDVTSKQLADRAGVSAQTMSGWLNHPIRKRFPDPPHMKGLADALGVTPDVIVDAISEDLGWRLDREPIRPDLAGAVGALHKTPEGHPMTAALAHLIATMVAQVEAETKD